jgi:adenylate kinase
MNKRNPFTFLFLGMSGCGKGTQADLLRQFLEKRDGKNSVLYVYAGSRMRKLIEEEKSLTSKLVNEIMRIGGKQPEFLAVWAWSQEMVDKLTENLHLILDGSPRAIGEAKLLDEAFEFYKRKNIIPILLDISYEWGRERLLSRKRFDDTEERIKNRLNYFEKCVKPAIEYYEKESKNKLIRINGEQTIQKVHEEIMQKLKL